MIEQGCVTFLNVSIHLMQNHYFKVGLTVNPFFIIAEELLNIIKGNSFLWIYPEKLFLYFLKNFNVLAKE